MNKLETLLKLADLVEEKSSTVAEATSNAANISGNHIVVLDRGLVYVGHVGRQGDFLHITDAKNIRKWGTTKGLGELVNGPLKDTVCDEVGQVLVPMRALISLIPCKGF